MDSRMRFLFFSFLGVTWLLAAKVERFCLEYVVDYNGTQAAIRAGYSEKSAYSQANRLLKNADVLARIRTLQEEQAKRLSLNSDMVVAKIMETYSRCMQAEPVMEWSYEEKAYKPTGEYSFDSKGALKALELIGKHIGMFAERHQVEVMDSAWFK